MSELVVLEFQSMTERLADDVERKCLALLAAFEAGQISAEDLHAFVATEVGRANAYAYGFADMATSAQIEAATGEPTPTTGVFVPDDDAGRLVEAVATILADPVDVAMQVKRLARAEPYAAAQRAAVASMSEQKAVEGWTRQTDGNPCQLCMWWSRGGRVWPKAHPFQRHPGCNCQPRAVVQQRIRSTEYTRSMER